MAKSSDKQRLRKNKKELRHEQPFKYAVFGCVCTASSLCDSTWLDIKGQVHKRSNTSKASSLAILIDSFNTNAFALCLCACACSRSCLCKYKCTVYTAMSVSQSVCMQSRRCVWLLPSCVKCERDANQSTNRETNNKQ